VNHQWGLSFIVPGIITAAMGIITFLFLIECECTPPSQDYTREKAAGYMGKIVGHGVGGLAA
jgi:OPA family glycerol-3-phosphate transporter-like MFS transporter 1/2